MKNVVVQHFFLKNDLFIQGVFDISVNTHAVEFVSGQTKNHMGGEF